jgi:hypothetical protein
VVSIHDIVVPDLPELSVDQIAEHWIKGARQLHADLKTVVHDLRGGCRPSIDLFIPNYWKDVVDLPEAVGAPLLELWHLAHDIGKETMTKDLERFRVTRSGIPGMEYYR